MQKAHSSTKLVHRFRRGTPDNRTQSAKESIHLMLTTTERAESQSSSYNPEAQDNNISFDIDNFRCLTRFEQYEKLIKLGASWDRVKSLNQNVAEFRAKAYSLEVNFSLAKECYALSKSDEPLLEYRIQLYLYEQMTKKRKAAVRSVSSSMHSKDEDNTGLITPQGAGTSPVASSTPQHFPSAAAVRHRQNSKAQRTTGSTPQQQGKERDHGKAFGGERSPLSLTRSQVDRSSDWIANEADGQGQIQAPGTNTSPSTSRLERSHQKSRNVNDTPSNGPLYTHSYSEISASIGATDAQTYLRIGSDFPWILSPKFSEISNVSMSDKVEKFNELMCRVKRFGFPFATKINPDNYEQAQIHVQIGKCASLIEISEDICLQWFLKVDNGEDHVPVLLAYQQMLMLQYEHFRLQSVDSSLLEYTMRLESLKKGLNLLRVAHSKLKALEWLESTASEHVLHQGATAQGEDPTDRLSTPDQSWGHRNLDATPYSSVGLTAEEQSQQCRAGTEEYGTGPQQRSSVDLSTPPSLVAHELPSENMDWLSPPVNPVSQSAPLNAASDPFWGSHDPPTSTLNQTVENSLGPRLVNDFEQALPTAKRNFYPFTARASQSGTILSQPPFQEQASSVDMRSSAFEEPGVLTTGYNNYPLRRDPTSWKPSVVQDGWKEYEEWWMQPQR